MSDINLGKTLQHLARKGSGVVTIASLFDQYSEGRSWSSLGQAVGRTGQAARAWRDGVHRMPQQFWKPAAEWFGVSVDVVREAAENSYSAGESTSVSTRGTGMLTVDERQELAAVSLLLAEVAERLAKIANSEEGGGTLNASNPQSLEVLVSEPDRSL